MHPAAGALEPCSSGNVHRYWTPNAEADAPSRVPPGPLASTGQALPARARPHSAAWSPAPMLTWARARALPEVARRYAISDGHVSHPAALQRPVSIQTPPAR